jgi:hypothetical protein
MSARSNLIGPLCLPLVVLLAWAPPAPAEEKVRVSVVAILASERDRTVDAKLECIARELNKRFPKLVGFRMAKLSCKPLEVGAQESFRLVGDQEAVVTVEHAANKKDRVRLKVTPPSMGEITYSTPCGKFLPIVTPYRTRDDGVLIIAIRVQPCRCK